MAHGIIRARKHGAVRGVKHFSHPLAGGIPGVTRDSSNLNYYPANATEWTTFMAAIGLGTGNPASVWGLQEAAGAFVDTIGGINLTDPETIVRQVTVTGTARKGIRANDGQANHRVVNATTAPNPAVTDVLQIVYAEMPTSPAANRDWFGMQDNCRAMHLDAGSGGKARFVTSANADTTLTVSSTRGWFAIRSRITATASETFFTPAEKIVGTTATPASGSMIYFGGQFGLASAAICAYMTQFTGASARLTDAQVKTLLQGLGETILWS